MLECTLGFAVVVKPEFIDRAVVDGPGMADIPLLKALFCRRSKAGDVCASGLELSKRRDQAVVVEIIVNAEILAVADSVVELERELVAAIRLHRDSHQDVAIGRRGHKLKQVHSRRVHASQRYLVVGENSGICDSRGYGCPANSSDGCLAP